MRENRVCMFKDMSGVLQKGCLPCLRGNLRSSADVALRDVTSRLQNMNVVNDKECS